MTNQSNNQPTYIFVHRDSERARLTRQLARLKYFQAEVYSNPVALDAFNKLNTRKNGIYAGSGETVNFDPHFNVDKEIERIEQLLEAMDND